MKIWLIMGLVLLTSCTVGDSCEKMGYFGFEEYASGATLGNGNKICYDINSDGEKIYHALYWNGTDYNTKEGF